MKWAGDPEKDLILSLMDDTGSAILGQVVMDGEKSGWHAHEYCSNNGAGRHLGLFETVDRAKVAVQSAVRGLKLNA